MIKNTIIALVAAASLAGVAAPAFASTEASITDNTPAFDADFVLVRLHDQGVKATNVEEWGDLVRAYVTQDDGTQVMKFFTTDTLTPVSL